MLCGGAFVIAWLRRQVSWWTAKASPICQPCPIPEAADWAVWPLLLERSKMPKFEISYIDPNTGDREICATNFDDTAGFTARERECLAYSLGDKNLDYTIKEL